MLDLGDRANSVGFAGPLILIISCYFLRRKWLQDFQTIKNRNKTPFKKKERRRWHVRSLIIPVYKLKFTTNIYCFTWQLCVNESWGGIFFGGVASSHIIYLELLVNFICTFAKYNLHGFPQWQFTCVNTVVMYFILPVILPASRDPLYLKLPHHSQCLSKLLLQLFQYSLFQYLQYDFFLFIF